MKFAELGSRTKHYVAFTKKELRDLIIAILIIAFVFSFKDFTIPNLILAVVVAALSFFIHELTHRIFAIMIGFKSDFKIWWGGLIASLLIVFASNGVVTLILPGGVVNSLIVRQRLGEFRYGLNYWENGLIAMYGPVANLILAFISKILLNFLPQNIFLEKLLIMNIIFAICTMLPIPPLDGVNTFFAGRVLYVLSFFGILGASVLIYFLPFLYSLLGGLIIMLLAFILYYIAFESPPK